MRGLIPLCAFAMASGLNAQPIGTTQASHEEAERELWRYTTCIVERDSAGVAEYLTMKGSREERAAASKSLVKDSKVCQKHKGELRFSANIFRNALGTAYVARNFSALTLPDFSAVPQIYRISALPVDAPEERILRRGLYQFVECVARNAPTDAIAIASAEPYSDEENEVFANLQPVMGDCLPVERGAKLAFSRLELRTLLGRMIFRLASKEATHQMTKVSQ